MHKVQSILLIVCALFSIASGAGQTYTYKTVGNLSLELDVYAPSQSSYSKYPVFFCIHGGGYVEGAKSGGFTSQELFEILSLGFVAVSIDYRLSPGALIADIVQDVQDAYGFVRTELVKDVTINPDAIVVFGRSAGGGLSVISGYMLSPRPKAIIAFYPYCTNFTDSYAYNPATPVSQIVVTEANLLRSPVISEYVSKGGVDPRSILFNTALKAGKGGWLLATTNATLPSDEVYAVLKQYSTVDNVDKDYPPTYLVHGLNDTLVPHEQSIMLKNVLDAANIDAVLDLVPGVGHSFDDKVTDTTSEMWKEHILPVFEFAEHIIASDLGVQTYYITN